VTALTIEQVKERIEELKSKEIQPELREVVDLVEMFVSSVETMGVQVSGDSQAILRAIDVMERAMDKRFEAMNERFIAVQREMNARFEALQREMGALREEMNARFEALQREMGALREEMNARFEALQREIDARFEAINERFVAIDDRFKTLMWWIPLWFTLFTGVFTTLLKLLRII
jgi:phage host-nuclease inhibitor protein Gam